MAMFRLTETIREDERGLLYVEGRLSRWLEPGRHAIGWRWQAEQRWVVRLSLDEDFASWSPELHKLVPEGAATELRVEAEQFAIVSRDGVPRFGLLPGRYLLWQLRYEVTAQVYDTGQELLQVPPQAWSLVPYGYHREVVVLPHQKAPLYVNGSLKAILEQGRYAVSTYGRSIQCSVVDICEQECQIVGQEVMSADKVSLRINLIVKYKITDVQQTLESVSSVEDALYSEAQLVARAHIAGVTVDQLLEGRNYAAMKMREELQPRAESWGVEIVRIDIKDAILPGDMKALLNRVIEAEKEAAAQVILRREETAATRSLANTAKMLEKNPMLLRMKELESIKEIAGKIQHLTVVASVEELLGRLRLPAPVEKTEAGEEA